MRAGATSQLSDLLSTADAVRDAGAILRTEPRHRFAVVSPQGSPRPHRADMNLAVSLLQRNLAAGLCTRNGTCAGRRVPDQP